MEIKFSRNPNLLGMKFTRLLVIGQNFNVQQHRKWTLLCECGKLSFASTNHLTSGTTKSCGCLRNEKMREWQLRCCRKPENGEYFCGKCKKTLPVSEFPKSNQTKCGLGGHCKACSKIYAWQLKHNISESEAFELAKQQNKCEVCLIQEVCHLDHDHETGAIRGFLCGNCNRALGLLFDNPETIQKLKEYIERFK